MFYSYLNACPIRCSPFEGTKCGRGKVGGGERSIPDNPWSRLASFGPRLVHERNEIDAVSSEALGSEAASVLRSNGKKGWCPRGKDPRWERGWDEREVVAEALQPDILSSQTKECRERRVGGTRRRGRRCGRVTRSSCIDRRCGRRSESHMMAAIGAGPLRNRRWCRDGMRMRRRRAPQSFLL